MSLLYLPSVHTTKTKKKKIAHPSDHARPIECTKIHIFPFFLTFTPHLRVKVSKLFLSRLIFQLWRRAKISPSLGSEQGYELRQFIETGLRNTLKLTWRRYVVKNKKKDYLWDHSPPASDISWCEASVRLADLLV